MAMEMSGMRNGGNIMMLLAKQRNGLTSGVVLTQAQNSKPVMLMFGMKGLNLIFELEYLTSSDFCFSKVVIITFLSWLHPLIVENTFNHQVHTILNMQQNSNSSLLI